MRILMVSGNYPPRTGGPASSVPVLSRKLGELGHEVFILTSAARGQPHVSDTTEGRVYRAYEIGKDYFSYPAIASRIASMTPMVHYLIRKKRIDIVHVHDVTVSAVSAYLGSASTSAPLIGKYTGDLVYEFNGLRKEEPSLDIEALWKEGALNRTLFALEKRILSNYRLIQAPSRYKAHFLADMGVPAEKIRVVPNGFELPAGTVHHDDGRTIFTAARLVKWKGLDCLLDAMPAVLEAVPNAKLVIAGDGPEKASLEAQVKKLGLGSHVHLSGSISHKEVYRQLAKAAVFALPSLYDPAPHTIVEALATGTPVVASAVGGVPEVVTKDVGRLVPPSDPEALADALINLLKDRKLRQRLGGNCKKTADKYSWDKIVVKILKMYGEALDR